MRIIITFFIVCLLAVVHAKDDKKKDADGRDKRNLEYNIAHHYNGPHNQFERRISTGPSYHHNSYNRPYAKGRPLAVPPYAVQMEPLVHYSQRDPLYETHHNANGPQTDTNHLGVPHQPVYLREPEPIIEIIIKESNVSLPAPATPPPLAPTKKEQVQVFYVKYKKNPNGQGKDSIVYEKPVPALTPQLPEEVDDEEESRGYQHQAQELVTLPPPPPSTTLRTIIHPESETYHGPSGIKVTFGKEGFDYDKRSNKPEDLRPESAAYQSVQFPQGRQLSTFNSFPRRPATNSFRNEPPRQPQSYRPFNYRPSQYSYNQQYSTIPKHLQNNEPKPAAQQFQQTFTNPTRQPVPYQPFESLRTQTQPLPSSQPPVQFRSHTHFPIPQQKTNSFVGQFSQQLPAVQQNQQFKTEQHFPSNNQARIQNLPARVNSQQIPQFQNIRSNFQNPAPTNLPTYQNQPIKHESFNQYPNQTPIRNEAFNQPQNFPAPTSAPFYQNQPIKHNEQFKHQPVQPIRNEAFNPHPNPPIRNEAFNQPQNLPTPTTAPLYQNQPIKNQGFNTFQQQNTFLHQVQNLQQHNQNLLHQTQNLQQQLPSVVPTGGELIPALPKYEQHISVPETTKPQSLALQRPQNLALQRPQTQNDYIQQQIAQANILQEKIRQQSHQPTTSKPFYYSTTPTTTTTESTTTEKPTTTTKDPKILNAQLPDEVPDDLRQQLLASGILNHASISVLDYDKVGDIPLSALPPDQLANFYSAGGGQQLAGSERVENVVAAPTRKIDEDQEADGSEIDEITTKPAVAIKVVHYDPETEKGQKIQDAYLADDAKQVAPVELDGEKYNRYLPLKVSGSQFPIPDVPELKGKKISSVVVLAPVSYDFAKTRKTREAKADDADLITEETLKELLKNPTKENYQKFIEKENRTRSDKQAVILLVTGPEKEIFMYDIPTGSVSKLDGELSSAFVDAAEANATDAPPEADADPQSAASNIVETRVPYTGTDLSGLSAAPSDIDEPPPADFGATNVRIIDPIGGDLETAASEHLQRFVDLATDMTASDSNDVAAAVALRPVRAI